MRYIKIHGEEVVDTIVDDISLQQRNDIDKKLKSEMVDRIHTKGFSFTILGDVSKILNSELFIHRGLAHVGERYLLK